MPAPEPAVKPNTADSIKDFIKQQSTPRKEVQADSEVVAVVSASGLLQELQLSKLAPSESASGGRKRGSAFEVQFEPVRLREENTGRVVRVSLSSIASAHVYLCRLSEIYVCVCAVAH